VRSVEVDGVMQPSGEVALKDDGARHEVRVVLGEPKAMPEGELRAEAAQ